MQIKGIHGNQAGSLNTISWWFRFSKEHNMYTKYCYKNGTYAHFSFPQTPVNNCIWAPVIAWWEGIRGISADYCQGALWIMKYVFVLINIYRNFTWKKAFVLECRCSLPTLFIQGLNCLSVCLRMHRNIFFLKEKMVKKKQFNRLVSQRSAMIKQFRHKQALKVQHFHLLLTKMLSRATIYACRTAVVTRRKKQTA